MVFFFQMLQIWLFLFLVYIYHFFVYNTTLQHKAILQPTLKFQLSALAEIFTAMGYPSLESFKSLQVNDHPKVKWMETLPAAKVWKTHSKI